MSNEMVVCVVFIVLSVTALQSVAANSTIFLEALSDITIPAGGELVTMLCMVRASNLFWYVNDTWYRHDTSATLQEKGFTFDEEYDNDTIRGTVVIDVSLVHNNTIIECVTSDSTENMSISSALIIIASVPLPPNPQFSIVNESSVQIRWEAPFTWQDYPIVNYTVEVTSQAIAELLTSVVLGPDSLSYTLTQMKYSNSCTNLTFSLHATSEVGTSLPGITYGAFPAAPSMFVESPNSMVIFTSEGKPYLDIYFTFPFLCAYNDATYSMRIEDNAGRVILFNGPYLMDWSGSGSNVKVEIREEELVVNIQYTVYIIVETLVGSSSASFRVNITCFGSPCDSPVINGSSKLNADKVVMIAGAGAILLLLIISCPILIFCIVICKQRQKKRAACNPETLAAMVPNPLYTAAGGVIYEEIPCSTQLPKAIHEREEGYVSIAEPVKDLQCNKQDTQVHEDTYTEMNPAGTLAAQLKGISYQPVGK